MEKVLITGISGGQGRLLTRRLRARYQVCGVDGIRVREYLILPLVEQAENYPHFSGVGSFDNPALALHLMGFQAPIGSECGIDSLLIARHPALKI